MLTVDLDDFMFELKDGTLKHVGPSNRSAMVKLYDVTDVESRPFGDERVKCTFEADDGNEVEVALFPAEVERLRDGLDSALEDLENVG